MNAFLRQSIWSTNNILKETAVLECENVKICHFPQDRGGGVQVMRHKQRSP